MTAEQRLLNGEPMTPLMETFVMRASNLIMLHLLQDERLDKTTFARPLQENYLRIAVYDYWRQEFFWTHPSFFK
jgi:hypothetical protein